MKTTEQNNNTEAKELAMQRALSVSKKPLWRWVEFTLLIAGAALLMGFAAARLDSYLSSRAALKTFADLDATTLSEQQTATHEKQPSEEDEATIEPDFANWSEGRIQAYKASNARQPGALLGVIQIPALHLVAPLLEGTNALTLNRGVGRIAGTARPGAEGNIGIAGHRDSFFRGLKDVTAGDAIELKTRSGMDTYLVEKIQVVAPSDVSVLREQETRSLTLVTCYPFYFVGSAPQRFVVTAFLTQHTPFGQTASVSR
jgi:sortase A